MEVEIRIKTLQQLCKCFSCVFFSLAGESVDHFSDAKVD